MEDPNPPGAAAPPNKLGVVGWPKSPPVVDVGDWKKFVAAGAAGCCWPNAPGVVLAPKGEVAKPKAGVLGAWPYAGVLAACPKAGVLAACPNAGVLAACPNAGVLAAWPNAGVLAACPNAGMLAACPNPGVLAACPKAPACPPNEGLAAKLKAGAGWPPKGVKGVAGVAGGVPKD